ncbi:hypothetical protein B0H19DRAFT_1269386 [Mycena capillaripes]|nr:hypothetical protein B0H19DRAFT_1269386 [Mycena capillaripes]
MSTVLRHPTPENKENLDYHVPAASVATFLGALDLIVLGSAVPTIATALNDAKVRAEDKSFMYMNIKYTWVGSAYALASTAFIPLSGSLADALGRQCLCWSLTKYGGIDQCPMIAA